MSWIVLSIVMSVVLTVILNIAVRGFPGRRRPLEDRVETWLESRPVDEPPRVRVLFPWKAMLVASVALTVLLNVIAALAR